MRAIDVILRSSRLLFFSLALSHCERDPGGSLDVAPRRVPAEAKARGAAPTHARRHVIIMIGDGMQLAHEIAASRYLFGTDNALSFHQLPTHAFVTTWDVSGYNARAAALGAPPYSPDKFDPLLGYDPAIGGQAPYPLERDNPARRDYFLLGPHPDSASTGTAMSTGFKTDYNNIAWESGDPPNGQLETSAQRLRAQYGMALGLVTTVPISHATPSSWFAHNVDRFDYFKLGREILLETRPDVIIGGGVGPEHGSFVDPNDLELAVMSNRWVFAQRLPGVDGAFALQRAARDAVAQRKGLLAVYGGAGGNFESPVASDTPGAPSVTRGSTENPTLGESAVAALEVLSQNPNGLFLMAEQGDIDWSNHNNDFGRMIGCVWDLHEAVHAVVAFVDRPGDEVDWTNTSLFVTADHANSYMRLEKPLGIGDLPTQLGSSYPDGDVTYGTGQHTAELITLSARGVAAADVEKYTNIYPGLRILDNTSIYELTLDAAR